MGEELPASNIEINSAQQDVFIKQVNAAAGAKIEATEDARWLAAKYDGEAYDSQVNETYRATTPFLLDDGRKAVYSAKNGVYTLALITDRPVQGKPGIFTRAQGTYAVEDIDAPGMDEAGRYCEYVSSKWFVDASGERVGPPDGFSEEELMHVPSKFEAFAQGEETQADALRAALVIDGLAGQMSGDTTFTEERLKEAEEVFAELLEGRAHTIPLTPDLELAVR
jgi:hypothetical protein